MERPERKEEEHLGTESRGSWELRAGDAGNEKQEFLTDPLLRERKAGGLLLRRVLPLTVGHEYVRARGAIPTFSLELAPGYRPEPLPGRVLGQYREPTSGLPCSGLR